MFKDKKLEKRVEKLEEQVKPKPLYKCGDEVRFMFCGEELFGKIINECACCRCGEYEYSITYLDDNRTPQNLNVSEKDICDEDVIDYLLERIEDLQEQVRQINKKK